MVWVHKNSFPLLMSSCFKEQGEYHIHWDVWDWSPFETALQRLACAVSVVFDSETPGSVACQVPLCMGFSRQEYWSRLSLPSPGESSHPRDRTRIFCISCIGRWILYHCTTWEALETSISEANMIFVIAHWKKKPTIPGIIGKIM